MSLLDIFRKTPGKKSSQDDYLSSSEKEKRANTHRYPPFDRGFPVDSVDEIIQSQFEIIDRIKVSMGMSDANFETYISVVIRKYAEYVHLLPATSKEHYKGAGGLFRLGLDVAFNSLQSASGIIFSGRESNDKRRILQPKWCYATFIAGLCIELYRPVASLVVVDDDGNEWPQLLMPLSKWLSSNNIERYYVRWNEALNGIDAVQRQSNSAYLLNQIIPQNCLQYLSAEGGHVITAMTASITGAARPNTGNLLYDIVMKSYDYCVDTDIKSNPELYGKFTIGAHMEPHIIDAMRSFYTSGVWNINQKGSRLWYTDEGLFCVWKPAFKEIRQHMLDKKMSGIPENEETMAEILMNASIIFPNKSGGPLWDIILPQVGKFVNAVRISDPSIIMLSKDEMPLNNYSLLNGDSKNAIEPAEPPLKNNHPESKPESSEQPAESKKDDGSKHETQSKQENHQENNKSETKHLADKDDKANKTPKQHAELKTDSIASSKEADKNPPKNESGKSSLFSSISEESRFLLGAILDDFVDGSSDFPIFYCDHGLAISVDEFRSKGQSEVNVIKEIGNRYGSGKRWLVTQPGSSKQTMTIEYENKNIECFVLQPVIAKGLGFPDKKG